MLVAERLRLITCCDLRACLLALSFCKPRALGSEKARAALFLVSRLFLSVPTELSCRCWALLCLSEDMIEGRNVHFEVRSTRLES